MNGGKIIKMIINKIEKMKNIEELTDQEILHLTDKDVERLINLKSAEEGIRFNNKPEPLVIKKLAKPDITVYTCDLFGDSLVFEDILHLQKVIKLLSGLKLQSLDHNYELPEEARNYITKKLKTSSWNSSPWDTITSKTVYSNKLYNSIKSDLKDNNALATEHGKVSDDWILDNNKVDQIRNDITSKRNEVISKYTALNRYCTIFKSEYLPIVDNNKDIAIKFLSNAYKLDAIQQQYVLDHYND